jgi:hypothetical protein
MDVERIKIRLTYRDYRLVMNVLKAFKSVRCSNARFTNYTWIRHFPFGLNRFRQLQ